MPARQEEALFWIDEGCRIAGEFQSACTQGIAPAHEGSEPVFTIGRNTQLWNDRRKYVTALFTQKVDLAYAILSDENPSNVDMDSEDLAVIERISQALLKTDKKNGRQYLWKKICGRIR